MLVNLIALVVIYKGSAVVFSISMAATIPLIEIVAALPIMGELQEQRDNWDYGVVGVILVCLFAYGSQPEQVQK